MPDPVEPIEPGPDSAGPPPSADPAQQAHPGDEPGGSVPQGMSWSWELDLETLQTVLNEPAPWNRPVPCAPAGPVPAAAAPGPASADGVSPGSEPGVGSQPGPDDAPAVGSERRPDDRSSASSEHPPGSEPRAGDGSSAGGEPGAASDPAAGASPADDAAEDEQEALLAALVEAELAGRVREVPVAVVAGRVAEALPPGPDLAGWLATTTPKDLEGGALAGVAASFRRLAAWAQAGELAAVAELTARSAATDDKIGVDDEGCPARIPDDAVAQVSLALR
jgi:hypothetical protein